MSHVIAPRFIGPALDDGGYQVGYSCRFNPGSNDLLSRTQSSPTSNQKMTLSAWIKKSGNNATYSPVFAGSSGSGAGGDGISFYDGGNSAIRVFFNGNVSGNLLTNAVFRDPTAWSHLVVAIDTTKPTASDRVRVYWNGDEITSFATASYPSQNYTITQLNANGNTNYIARDTNTNESLPGYLSQFTWIDGQQLTPANFGEFDSNGVWRPIDVSGLTFGTNGFLLDFAHNSTANDLGLDAVGSNDFTASGLTTADQMIDTPTDNFATWNPLIKPSAATEVRAALTDGNLMTVDAGASLAYAMGSVAIGAHGKFYWEAHPTVGDTNYIGLAKTDFTTFLVGNNALIWAYTSSAFVYGNGTTSAYGATYTTGDVIGVAYDAENNTLEFFKNNVSQGTAFSSGMNSQPVVPFWGAATGGTNTCEINFGQRPFTYVPPSGFVALNTANLPEPASAGSVTPVTGSFSGNGSTDGPFVWLGYTPDTTTTSTINGNTITWGTHARPTAGGFKVITSSSSYNNNGVSNSYSIAVAHPFGGEDTTPMTAR